MTTGLSSQVNFGWLVSLWRIGSAALAAGAILQRLGQVWTPNGLGLLQISERSCHFQYPVSSTQRQAEPFAGPFEPLLVFGLQLAVAAQSGQVEKRVSAALALQLNAPRIGHLLGDELRRFITGKRGVQRRSLACHGQVQVDTVEQRPG